MICRRKKYVEYLFSQTWRKIGVAVGYSIAFLFWQNRSFMDTAWAGWFGLSGDDVFDRSDVVRVAALFECTRKIRWKVEVNLFQ